VNNFWNIFLWLYVAFLVADYPLQLNVVFRVRYKYRYGGLLHVGIHFLSGLFFLLPYLVHWQIWALFTATIILHYFIDTVNKKSVWMLLADHAAHFGLIAVLAWLARNLQPAPLPALCARWYLDPAVPLYGIGYLAATYAGTIFIFFLKMTFRPGYFGRPLLGYEKTTGVIARAVTATAVILGFKLTPAFFAVAPVPELLRLYRVWTRRGEDGHYRDVYIWDVAVSFVWAAAIGVALSFVE